MGTGAVGVAEIRCDSRCASRARMKEEGCAPVLEVAGGVRLIDDANLTDECWVAEKREVELFENERFGGDDSNLTFSLDPGWAFVTTEDWRADLEAQWARDGRARTADDEGVAEAAEVADDDGWVYTNACCAHMSCT
ncbi:hypothetical protein DFH06DRAFT_1319340 [Mycena polygramma]|nr:hypothetical protein DFH06DRAFT_1319340 [Mycena polygramma]